MVARPLTVKLYVLLGFTVVILALLERGHPWQLAIAALGALVLVGLWLGNRLAWVLLVTLDGLQLVADHLFVDTEAWLLVLHLLTFGLLVLRPTRRFVFARAPAGG